MALTPRQKSDERSARRLAKKLMDDANQVFNPKTEAEKERARRELSRRHLLYFTMRFVPDYLPGWVHKDICARLERFMRDIQEAQKKKRPGPRLMLAMPPRSGKSELVSRNFPAWYLGHNPNHEIISCSYSSSLAMGFSRKVKEIIKDPAYNGVFPDTRLHPEAQATEQWLTTEAGGYAAAGVGGPITGKGAHCLIIDDPIKNREEAESETTRESIWDWYTSTAYTRLAPGGGVLVIQTRWHDDDLSGRLIEKMEKREGDDWEVVTYPAIATEDERYRRKGEALHPERYPLETLKQIEQTVGPRDWQALYQQTPAAEDGDYFKKDMFRWYKGSGARPKLEELSVYAAWDLAVGQRQSNDYSVGCYVGVDHKNQIWVLHVERGKWDSLALVDTMLDLHKTYKPRVTGIERGHIEMAIGPFLDRRIRERGEFMYYEPLKIGRADKQARAQSIRGRMQQGMVLFDQNDPAHLVMQSEMLRFPNGKHDDCVDAIAHVGQMLEQMTGFRAPAPKRKPSQLDARIKKILNQGKTNTGHLGA